VKTLDASALINLLLVPEAFHQHVPILKDNFIAPAILVPEVLNAFKKAYLTKRVSRAQANQAARHFASFNITLVTLSSFRQEMWGLVNNLSTYDASYVLVARLTQTPLVTSDSRLVRAAPSDIEVVLLR
jgi:hypothetical protein